MRHRLACLLIMLCITGTAHAADGPPVQEVQSPSGLKAWLVTDSSLPIISIKMAWEGGSSADPIDRHGLTYLMASLLNEGAGDLSPLAFQQAMADSAMRFGFEADRDNLIGSLRCLSQYMARCFELLKLALTAPRFDEAAIELMKSDHGARYRQRTQNPHQLANDAFHAAAFEGHPYAHSPLGTLESVAAITRRDLQQHFTRHIARDNMYLSVVGDIDGPRLAAMMDDVFAALPRKNGLPKVAPVKMSPQAASLHIDREGPQTTIIFGTQGIDFDDPDFFPAYVMNLALAGGGLSTILGEEIREKRGLAYGVGTYLSMLRHADSWIGSVASDNRTAQQAMDVIQQQLNLLSGSQKSGKTSLDAAKIEAGKNYLIGSYALQFDSGEKIADQMNFAQIEGRPMSYFKTRNERIRAVTLAQSLAAAQKLFSNNLRIVSVGGTGIALEK